mgnify:FL=1
MSLPFELYVAIRYLFARRKQASLASTSFISILSVAVGVMALIIALALMEGLSQGVRDRILGAQAHVFVYKMLGQGFSDYRTEAELLNRLPRVVGASPSIHGRGLVRTRQGDAFINVKGVDPFLEINVTQVANSIEYGEWLALDSYEGESMGAIVIGEELARRLGAFVGDEVSIVTQTGSLSPMGMLPRPRQLEVVGIFSLGLYEYDSSYGYVSIDLAKRIFRQDRIDMMELKIDDIYASRDVAQAIPEALGAAYVTDDWTQLNQSLYSALWLEKMAISIALALIMLVAALHIVASLVMLVMEKSRDIAILKTMGAGVRSIRQIFVLQGVIIGVVGTAVGAVAGYVIAVVMDHYRVIRMPPDAYQISYVPFVVDPIDFLVVVVSAVVVCLVATIYPSRHAGRVDPAEALRFQ